MELSSVFGGEYLKSADLKGREPVLVIETVNPKKFDNGNKLVITFQGAKKSWVCNKTNSNRIAYSHGTNTDNWIGKEIQLYVDLVDFQGKPTEAIRCRPAPKRAAADPGYQVSSGVPSGVKTVKSHAPVENDFHDDSVPF